MARESTVPAAAFRRSWRDRCEAPGRDRGRSPGLRSEPGSVLPGRRDLWRRAGVPQTGRRRERRLFVSLPRCRRAVPQQRRMRGGSLLLERSLDGNAPVRGDVPAASGPGRSVLPHGGLSASARMRRRGRRPTRLMPVTLEQLDQSGDEDERKGKRSSVASPFSWLLATSSQSAARGHYPPPRREKARRRHKAVRQRSVCCSSGTSCCGWARSHRIPSLAASSRCWCSTRTSRRAANGDCAEDARAFQLGDERTHGTEP
jgi:hypothetical protein